MAFKPLNTADVTTSYRKVLLYAEAGFGKTTQAKYYQEHYGPGFIISGESGLSSIRSAGIDYLPFSSFAGPSAPDKGNYSFADICALIKSPEFAAASYKWLMLDSLTELSDMIMAWAVMKAEREAAEAGKKVNGFDKFNYYSDKMLGSAKFVRDLPYHVIITALAKETETEDGDRSVLPSVQGNKVQGQLAGIFDFMLAGMKVGVKSADGKGVETKRFLLTDDYRGHRAKARDEDRVLKTVEDTASVIDIIKKLDASSK